MVVVGRSAGRSVTNRATAVHDDDFAVRGRRSVGHHDPGRLGIRHHQLRLVDRYWPRRHTHLRHPVSAQTDLADLDQPFRRSDDHLRRRAGRYLSNFPSWPAMVRLLTDSLSIDNGRLAAVPESTGLVLLRGQYVLHRIAHLLVPGNGSRPGQHPRPRENARQTDRLRHFGPGLAWLGPPLATLRTG